MCRTVGYRVSLPLTVKTTQRCVTEIPIQRSFRSPILIQVKPRFVSDPCFILFRVDMVEVGTFLLVNPLSDIIRCFHLYSKVCTRLRRKWESLVSYCANKPALFICKRKVDLLSQLIGN